MEGPSSLGGLLGPDWRRWRGGWLDGGGVQLPIEGTIHAAHVVEMQNAGIAANRNMINSSFELHER